MWNHIIGKFWNYCCLLNSFIATLNPDQFTGCWVDWETDVNKLVRLSRVEVFCYGCDDIQTFTAASELCKLSQATTELGWWITFPRKTNFCINSDMPRRNITFVATRDYWTSKTQSNRFYFPSKLKGYGSSDNFPLNTKKTEIRLVHK